MLNNRIKKEVYAGLCLGMLIGTIIGLSIAGVTGIILGALTSLLAAFFGLQPAKDNEPGNQIIIGTFSLACLLSMFGGLYLRTHDVMAPSLANEIKKYKEVASFSPGEIKQIVLFKELGLVPKEYSFSKDAKQTSQAGVLMSGEGTPVVQIDKNASLQDLKSAFDNSGGKFADLNNTVSSLIPDTAEQHKLLLQIKNILCE